MTETIHFKLAGVFQYPEGKAALKKLATGESVIAQREPRNPHDPNAVAILANDVSGVAVKLGYVPHIIALQLKERQILGAHKGFSWDEIAMDIA